MFQNIEINIRELGYGDTRVNKTMKTLNKIFYDILIKTETRNSFSFIENPELINNYFYNNKKQNKEKTNKLAKYMQEFQIFCFDLHINNVLNGYINFKFK